MHHEHSDTLIPSTAPTGAAFRSVVSEKRRFFHRDFVWHLVAATGRARNFKRRFVAEKRSAESVGVSRGSLSERSPERLCVILQKGGIKIRLVVF